MPRKSIHPAQTQLCEFMPSCLTNSECTYARTFDMTGAESWKKTQQKKNCTEKEVFGFKKKPKQTSTDKHLM